MTTWTVEECRYIEDHDDDVDMRNAATEIVRLHTDLAAESMWRIEAESKVERVQEAGRVLKKDVAGMVYASDREKAQIYEAFARAVLGGGK